MQLAEQELAPLKISVTLSSPQFAAQTLSDTSTASPTASPTGLKFALLNVMQPGGHDVAPFRISVTLLFPEFTTQKFPKLSTAAAADPPDPSPANIAPVKITQPGGQDVAPFKISVTPPFPGFTSQMFPPVSGTILLVVPTAVPLYVMQLEIQEVDPFGISVTVLSPNGGVFKTQMFPNKSATTINGLLMPPPVKLIQPERQDVAPGGISSTLEVEFPMTQALPEVSTVTFVPRPVKVTQTGEMKQDLAPFRILVTIGEPPLARFVTQTLPKASATTV